jgi:hypothetical protein
MPITMQYGPISAALGLAQQAGNGQGFAEQRSAQLQAQQLAQQAQDELDKQYATQVQDTMQQQQMQQQNQLSQGEMAQKAAIERANLQLQQQNEQNRSLQLQQQIGYQNGMLGVQQQNAKTKETASQNTADYRQGELGNQQVALENRADQTLLQSQTKQAQSIQAQIQFAEQQSAKVKNNPLSNPEDAAAWDQQAAALKAQLADGVDPATGQPIPGLGSAMKITQARIAKRSQQVAQPQQAQAQQPWGSGSLYISGGSQQQQPQAAPQSASNQVTPESTGGLAPPEVYKPLQVGAASQLKLPIDDPRVQAAVKKQLQQMGYTGITR